MTKHKIYVRRTCTAYSVQVFLRNPVCTTSARPLYVYSQKSRWTETQPMPCVCMRYVDLLGKLLIYVLIDVLYGLDVILTE